MEFEAGSRVRDTCSAIPALTAPGNYCVGGEAPKICELVEELEAGLELDLLTIFSSSDWVQSANARENVFCNFEIQPLADCITRSEW